MKAPASALAQPGRLPLATRISLTLEVVATRWQVRQLLRRTDFLSTLPTAGSTGADQRHLAASRRLARAVIRTLAVLPGDSRCLARSLVLRSMLMRRGIESRLVIGVRPGQDFGAHAWVEHAGVPLLDPGDRAFERLVER